MSKSGSAILDRVGKFYLALFSVTIWGAVIALLMGANPVLVAVAAFAGVIGAALMIALGAESAQFFVSQGLAVAVIALLQIMPEFAVEATIAYEGKVDLMLANFTGSNRLLMGVGWPLIYGVAAFFHRRKYGRPLSEIRLRPEAVIEIIALFAPSLYFLIVLEKGTLTIADAVILATMFIVYMVLLNRLPPEGEETKEDLVAPSRRVVEMRPRYAKSFILMLMLGGGAGIVFVAGPFVHSLEAIAGWAGITTFFFIQWVAPFLSEFPEKVSAFYWSMRIRLAPMALLNMISSKVNQWTLLILFIPTFYSIGLGKIADVQLDWFHKHEIILSIAMTVYGATTLLKRRLVATNALILFTLWFIQFLFPVNLPWTTLDTRMLTTIAFGFFTVMELALHHREIHTIRDLRDTFDLMVRRAEKRRVKPAVPSSAGSPTSNPTEPK